MFKKLVYFIDKSLYPQRVKDRKPCDGGWVWLATAAKELLASQLKKNAQKSAKGDKITSADQQLSLGQIVGAANAASGSTIQGGQGGTDTGMQMVDGKMTPTWSPYQANGQIDPKSFTTDISQEALKGSARQAMNSYLKDNHNTSSQAEGMLQSNNILAGLGKGALGMPQSDTQKSPWFYAGALLPSIIRSKLGVDTTMEAAQRQKMGNYYDYSSGGTGNSLKGLDGNGNNKIDPIMAEEFKKKNRVIRNKSTGELITVPIDEYNGGQ